MDKARGKRRHASKNGIRLLFDAGGRSSRKLDLDLDNFYKSRLRRRTQFAHQISTSLQTAGITVDSSAVPLIPDEDSQLSRTRGMLMTLSPGEEYENYQKLSAALSKLNRPTSVSSSTLAFTPSEAIDEGEENVDDAPADAQSIGSQGNASHIRRASGSSRRGSGKAVSDAIQESLSEDDDAMGEGDVSKSTPDSVEGTATGKPWGPLKDIVSVAATLPRRLSKTLESASTPSVAPIDAGGTLPPFVGTGMPRARLHSQRSIRGRENLVHSRNKYMIDPLGRSRLVWDIISIFFILYNAIVLPFEASFVSSAPDSGFETFLDIFFLFDIILTFNTAVDRDGSIRYDRSLAANSYIRGWFLIDLIAALPYSFIFDGTNTSPTIKRSVKLLRLIRLLRLLRVSRILRRIQNAVFIRSTLSALLKYCLMVLLLSHWFSCIFHAIGAAHLDAGETNWISDQKLQEPLGSKWDRYVAALYFSFQTLATIGYGDVAGVNADERLFSIFAMIAGGGVFAYGITNIVELVSSLTIQETRFRQKMDEVNEYMNARELPIKLRMEIREFYHNTRQSRESKLNAEHQILSDLSSKLRSKIALSINDQFLRKFPFFTGSDPNFLMELALNMRMIHFAPLEDVIVEGEIGHEMFFIFRGAIEVRKADVRIGILGENQYFGEMAILNADCRRTASVRTLCFCELRMLSRTRFLEALALFPAMQVKMAQIARGRAAPLAALKVSGKAKTTVAPSPDEAGQTDTRNGGDLSFHTVNEKPASRSSMTKSKIHTMTIAAEINTDLTTEHTAVVEENEHKDILPKLPLSAATRRKSFVRGLSQLEIVQQYNTESFQPARSTTSARLNATVHRASASSSALANAGIGRNGSFGGVSGNGEVGVTTAMSLAIAEITSLLEESSRQQQVLTQQMTGLKARLDRHLAVARKEKRPKFDERHASME